MLRHKKNTNRHRKVRETGVLTILIAAICAGLLSGCANVRLTTGFRQNEFVTYQNQKIGMDRAMLLLMENKYSYEILFDTNIWKEEVDGVSMSTYVKDMVRDTIEHLIFLRKMAKDMDIQLTEEEHGRVSKAANDYLATYETTNELAFDEETVRAYYEDLILGEKAFYAITSDVDTEVSTDEARIIDVQYLFFSKTEMDEDYKPVKLSEAACNKKRQLAANVLSMIREGEDLINLVSEYSDDTKYFLELGRGDYDKDFENTAFNLEMGEVSEVVETEVGFYIIKCTNDNVSNDYERRKQAIVLERRKEIFAEKYAEYTINAELHYNDRFWSEYPLETIAKGTGCLQKIFDDYFSE